MIVLLAFNLGEGKGMCEIRLQYTKWFSFEEVIDF